ncbi:hypothetical protein GCM10010303_47350 [Streptomyces purpurascens]|nr:hypothetical protein GCM10010303_47350 [Streptomyces purpurascens]
MSSTGVDAEAGWVRSQDSHDAPAPAHGEKGTCRGVSARSGWRVNASQSVSHPIAPFRGRTPPDTSPTHHPAKGATRTRVVPHATPTPYA